MKKTQIFAKIYIFPCVTTMELHVNLLKSYQKKTKQFTFTTAQKIRFSLRTASLNETKSTGNCGKLCITIQRHLNKHLSKLIACLMILMVWPKMISVRVGNVFFESTEGFANQRRVDSTIHGLYRIFCFDRIVQQNWKKTV